MSNKFLSIDFLKYITIGLLGLMIDIAAFYFLNIILKINFIYANGIAMLLGSLFNATQNKKFTFKDKNKKISTYLFQYYILFSVNLVLSNGIIEYLIKITSSDNITFLKSIVSFSIAIVNFYIFKKIIFRHR